MATLAALTDRRVLLTGSRGLSGRPIDALLGALTTLGARCRHARGSGLPVEIQGPIHGGAVALDASQSSQFASSLLLALPTLASDSQLDLRGSIVSEPYLDATMAVLGRHGVRVALRGRRFRISGNQRYRGSTFRVPGDASSAAYLWAAAVLGGGTVRVRGIPLERWPQADLAVLELLERTGGRVRKHADGATVSSGPREPFWIDLTAAPDLYPLAGVLAATVPGKSRILGAEHVVLKESDRRAGTTELVRRFGARARVTHAGLVVEGREQPRPVSVPRLTDHRMVMSAAVGALAARAPSLVGTAEAVGKSFPGFWDALEELSRGRQRW